MTEENISLAEIGQALRRNIVPLAVSFLVCVGTALVLAFTLPQQFKSTAKVSIQSSYFRNPMVSDVLPEEHDQSELRAQRDALLARALDDVFVDSLAERYAIYELQGDSLADALERKMLRERIEYFSLNPNTYQISVRSSDREQAFAMNQNVIEQMTTVLAKNRTDTLRSTRRAIDRHVSKLGIALKRLSTNSSVQDVEELRMELARVNSDLDALLLHYTERHPEVFKLRRKARSLSNLIAAVEKQEETTPAHENDGSPLSAAAKEPIQAVYNDLLKKLNYLNIVLEIEEESGVEAHVSIVEAPALPTGAYFPNKKLFLLLGAFAGVLFGLGVSLYRELRRGTFAEPEYMSEALGLPFLGELPPLGEETKPLQMLPNNGPRGTQRELPWQSVVQ